MTELWQLQPVDAVTLSLADIHALAARVERVVRQRNRLGLLICAVEVLTFSSMWLAYPNFIQRVGCAWTVIGLLFMSLQLLKRPAAKPAGDLGLAACIDFQRAELARQRDFHRGWWFWSRFLMFVPGPLIFGWGAWLVFTNVQTPIALIIGIYIAIAISAVPTNLRLAREYQRRIQTLG